MSTSQYKRYNSPHLLVLEDWYTAIRLKPDLRLLYMSAGFHDNSAEHEISISHKKLNYRQLKKFLAFSLSDVVFIMLINVKMPTIVGNLTFMSRINFVLS